MAYIKLKFIKPIKVFSLLFLFSSQLFGQAEKTFTDTRDNKLYSYTKIGDQFWMIKNLAYKNEDGCFSYKHRKRNIQKYGYLYTLEGAQESCPKGWKLPSNEDYKELIDFISSNERDLFTKLTTKDDYGLSFQYGGMYWSGYYDKFVRGRFPYKNISYWCSDDPYVNQYGVTILYKFSIYGYFETAGMAFEDNIENAFPVRCIKYEEINE